ncbi:DUF2510 domain-containing protein [Streptomyces atratus]|uniref:DUF2510 domain-containing protein n=1 Tax=Streptomyces atratus TaxID=1893 RepID=UPI002259E563|nr:DUF2510 domain-containing protein [Streptomyces atratus]MCX5339254.1 DUF2510 domain-containing protein [Streptomyces atratus]
MSPPGWHPDPGYTGIGPIQERWWDGTQWTDHLRVPPATIRRRRMRIGITAGVVVLAAIGGGLFLLSDESGDSKENAATAPSTAPSDAPGRGPGAPGGGGESQAPEQQVPQTEDGFATDLASGISLPVPDGWTGKSGIAGAGVTTGEYACPGDTSQECVRGGVFSMPAKALKLDTTSAKATATKDISANATESYGEKIYGGITSHQELKSGAVTVAGEQGYLVRWKVVTKSGDDGYVQSLAFPSPRSKDTLIVVRSGFDINTKAPELSVMDDITKGIKAASGTGSGPGTTA